MTVLHGQVEPGTVANVMQYLALSRATGRFTVVDQGSLHGDVYFEEGLVVAVEARPFRDLAALAVMLSWEGGSFTFRRGVPAPRRSMRQEVELLLLQVSRRPGLAAAQPADSLLGQDAVLAPSSGEGAQLSDDQFYAHAGEELLLSLSALHLWRRLDGVSSLSQLAAAGGRPVDELVAAAHELVEHQLADFVSLQVADPRFARELVREAIDLLGPVGEVVVEDAFFALGLSPDSLPVGQVDELFEELARGFPWRFRAEFMRRASALRSLFALEPPAAEAVSTRGAVEGVR